LWYSGYPVMSGGVQDPIVIKDLQLEH